MPTELRKLTVCAFVLAIVRQVHHDTFILIDLCWLYGPGDSPLPPPHVLHGILSSHEELTASSCRCLHPSSTGTWPNFSAVWRYVACFPEAAHDAEGGQLGNKVARHFSLPIISSIIAKKFPMMRCLFDAVVTVVKPTVTTVSYGYEV